MIPLIKTLSHPQKAIRFFISSILVIFILVVSMQTAAQQVALSREQVIALTSEWKGERLPDGRPNVADNLLARLKNISLEEAWGVLRNAGYNNQFEGDWMILKPGQALVGRALTVQYLPKRQDYDNAIKAKGKEESRIGGFNSWPIDMLKPGDIYVADGYGKIIDGTLIGDNLGNSIYTKSKNGVIFYGSVRDTEGLEKIEGFNAWVKGYDPSYIQEMMLGGINVPIRIGRATVLPGDAVLAKKGGIVFIPAHLVADVVINAEFIALRDMFGHQRLREGKYTAGQIDQQWSDDIKKDFLQWLDQNPDKLPMSRSELDVFMKKRTW
ncbi:RraA family protein [Fulvivirgaceae bacterium PWU5]|uniref:Putative 4-hydroxy-4-methyl-2-oxoglutarate aldolase n=2 Tax=Dawidia cretensis TaxID=2782350 RepID=A0AAP2GN86_9BACT|nr:RraA family protein [Dawidia cretensis]